MADLNMLFQKNLNAVSWLLASGHPAITDLVFRDLYELPENHPTRAACQQDFTKDLWVAQLLSGQQEDGAFGMHPYKKWIGAHWRLVSLVELGAPPGLPPILRAANTVLDWLTGDTHRRAIKTIDGLTRRCASQEGNALAACSRLGFYGDARLQLLAESLAAWQWPDGGWNCDKRIQADHSSFYESLSPLWGLIEYYKASGDPVFAALADRTIEFFAVHHMYRSDKTGEVIHSDWLRLHYPLYWHYDILQGLLIISRMRDLNDPRFNEALDWIERKRLPSGCWKAEGWYWSRSRGKSSHVEVVDWGRSDPNLMITLNALCVLKSAGRLGEIPYLESLSPSKD